MFVNFTSVELQNYLLENCTAPNDLEDRYLGGALDVFDAVADTDGGTLDDIYENLIAEFSSFIIKQIVIENGAIRLYRGLVNTTLASLNESLGAHWTFDKSIAQDIYSEDDKPAILTVDVDMNQIDFINPFLYYIGNACHQYEINVKDGTTPSNLRFNDIKLDGNNYTIPKLTA